MVGWANADKDAQSTSSAENEILSPAETRTVFVFRGNHMKTCRGRLSFCISFNKSALGYAILLSFILFLFWIEIVAQQTASPEGFDIRGEWQITYNWHKGPSPDLYVGPNIRVAIFLGSRAKGGIYSKILSSSDFSYNRKDFHTIGDRWVSTYTVRGSEVEWQWDPRIHGGPYIFRGQYTAEGTLEGKIITVCDSETMGEWQANSDGQTIGEWQANKINGIPPAEQSMRDLDEIMDIQTAILTDLRIFRNPKPLAANLLSGIPPIMVYIDPGASGGESGEIFKWAPQRDRWKFDPFMQNLTHRLDINSGPYVLFINETASIVGKYDRIGMWKGIEVRWNLILFNQQNARVWRKTLSTRPPKKVLPYDVFSSLFISNQVYTQPTEEMVTWLEARIKEQERIPESK
jgi:hypothetical protein